VRKVSEKQSPSVERSVSAGFGTVACDFYEYWVEPETTRILFYTQHYVPKETQAFKPISKDTIYRELQVEVWMPSSMAENLAKMILEKRGYKVVAPVPQGEASS